VTYESFLFAVLFIVFHFVARVLVGLFERETRANSVPAIGGGGFPAGVVCTVVTRAPHRPAGSVASRAKRRLSSAGRRRKPKRRQWERGASGSI
jgi:hypothetical protein